MTQHIVLGIAAIVALSFVAIPSHAQVTASARLPLERYAATLNVSNATGELLRSSTNWGAVRRREILDSMIAAASVSAQNTRVDTTRHACPMPVFARDSVAAAPMPVHKTGGQTASAGRIVGCQNTLRPVK